VKLVELRVVGIVDAQRLAPYLVEAANSVGQNEGIAHAVLLLSGRVYQPLKNKESSNEDLFYVKCKSGLTLPRVVKVRTWIYSCEKSRKPSSKVIRGGIASRAEKVDAERIYNILCGLY
jgi:hypothetical protein